MRKILLASASLSVMLMASVSASAGMFRPYPTVVDGISNGFSSRAHIAGSFMPKAVDANGNMTPDNTITAPHSPDLEPVGALLSPTGQHWFYTLETDGDKLLENEYYTKWNFKTFKLTVYDGTLTPDGKMNVVGYAYGKANFPEGAARCGAIAPALQVTSKFFNSNSSDYEVAVSFNFNPDDSKYLYGAKGTTQVYTLQKNMPAQPQKPVFETMGLLSGALNGNANGVEGFVLSFTEETTWDNEKDQHGKVTLKVYKAAEWGKAPEMIAKQTSRASTGGGSNEPNPFFIAVHGNDVYSVHSYYEYPWLDDSSDDNPVMRPDNNFIIELYKPTAKNPIISDMTDPNVEKPTPYKTVTIPCSNPDDPDTYQWREYALGNFSGHSDVTWDFSEGGDDPCFIITIVDSNHLDESIATYEVWTIDGKRIKTFGKDSGLYVRFPSTEGLSEQFGFDIVNEDGTNVTQLVNWPSLEVVGELPILFEYEGNIFSLTSVPSRVVTKDGVLYGANVMPSMGEENTGGYIAYFTMDGELHHMDKLRLPENTAKAYAYIDPTVIDPYIFNTDEKQEYLMWLYTWKGENPSGDAQVGTDLALAVVDNNGSLLCKYSLTDGHSRENAFVSNNPDTPMIVVTWRDASLKENPDQIDFINLPLNSFEGEGTVENPYLIRTFGDLDKVRNNLTSHFALATDIDCGSRALRSIQGAFLGSLDGRGHAIRNVYLPTENTGALFMQVGERPQTDDAASSANEPTAVIKNIIFDGVKFTHTGSSKGTKQYAMLAHTVRYAEFNDVQVINPQFELSDVKTNFGVMAYKADKSKFIDCAVKGADININQATTLGGIAASIDDVQIANAYVTGKFVGSNNVGGVVGVAISTPSYITNCHVNAEVSASVQTAGSVVGQNSSRSVVSNNVVEGTLAAPENAGAVSGYFEMSDGVDPDVRDFLIEGNVVALTALNGGDKPDCVHRVVGFSSADANAREVWVPNPDWNSEDPDSPAGEYVKVPAEPDAAIGANYVVSDLEVIDKTEGLVTEGTAKPLDETDQEFFAEIGFKFGNTTEEPWVMPTAFTEHLPKLYYEDMVGATLNLSASVYEGKIGTTLTVIVEAVGFDLIEAAGSGLIEVTSANEAVAAWGYDMVPVEDNPNAVGLPFTLGAEPGETEINVTYKGLKATAKVVVTDGAGIINVEADKSAVTYVNGVINAEGRAIVVYDAQGRQAAVGFGQLSTAGLSTGLYIVRATSEGDASTLKIMVK